MDACNQSENDDETSLERRQRRLGHVIVTQSPSCCIVGREPHAGSRFAVNEIA